jgi:primosomal protein N''
MEEEAIELNEVEQENLNREVEKLEDVLERCSCDIDPMNCEIHSLLRDDMF